MKQVKTVANYQIKLREILGKGAYGTVYEGINLKTKETVAIKIIEKERVEGSQYLKNAIINEIVNLKNLHSENIVRYINVMQSKKHIYIVLEKADGPLNTKNVDKHKVKQYIYQIANGFREIISKGIIHRDLKPENILIKNGIVKICDFGFSRISDEYEKNSTSVGTIPYMSPQVLNFQERYTHLCDIWSFGVACYEIYSGNLPWKQQFTNRSNFCNALMKLCERGIYFQDNFDPLLKSLIKGCLVYEENKRFTWKQIFNHPYFQGKFQHQQGIFIASKEYFILSKLREEINFNCINIQKFLLHFPQHLSFHQFQQFLQSISNNLSNNECEIIYQSVQTEENTQLEQSHILSYFEKRNIMINIKHLFANEVYQGIQITNISDRVYEKLYSRRITVKKIFRQFLVYNAKQNNSKLLFAEFYEMINRLDKQFSENQILAIFYKMIPSKEENRLTVENAQVNLCRILQIPINAKIF